MLIRCVGVVLIRCVGVVLIRCVGVDVAVLSTMLSVCQSHRLASVASYFGSKPF